MAVSGEKPDVDEYDNCIRDTKHNMQHTELQLQLQKDKYIAIKGDNGIQFLHGG